MCTYCILKSVMNNPTLYLNYEQRKNKFLCYALIYIGIWLSIGVVFLIGYLQRQNQKQLIVLMGICFVYAVIEIIIAAVIYQKDDFQWNSGVIVIENTMGPHYPLRNTYYPHLYPPVPYLADNPYNNYSSPQFYPYPAPNYMISQSPPVPPKKPVQNLLKILALKESEL